MKVEKETVLINLYRYSASRQFILYQVIIFQTFKVGLDQEVEFFLCAISLLAFLKDMLRRLILPCSALAFGKPFPV